MKQKGFAHLLVLLLSVILIAAFAGWYTGLIPQKKNISTVDNPQIVSTPNPENVYSDKDAGFSFNYPKDAVLYTGMEDALNANVYIDVQTKKLDTLEEELPSGFGRKDALLDMASLEKGEEGLAIDWMTNLKVQKVGESNVKTGYTYGRFDVCSLSIEKRAIFYNNGYQVFIKVFVPAQEMEKVAPQYFVQSESCGEKSIWKDSSEFHKDVQSNTLPEYGKKWLSTFDLIMSSLKIE